MVRNCANFNDELLCNRRSLYGRTRFIQRLELFIPKERKSHIL